MSDLKQPPAPVASSPKEEDAGLRDVPAVPTPRPEATSDDQLELTPEQLAALRREYDEWFSRRLVWRPIETAPVRQQAMFWLVRKGEDEVYCDSSGNPICAHPMTPAHLFVGVKGAWSSLLKATHWMPLPPPPGVDGGASGDAGGQSKPANQKHSASSQPPAASVERLRDALASTATRWEGPNKPGCWCERSPILTGAHDARCTEATAALGGSYLQPPAPSVEALRERLTAIVAEMRSDVPRYKSHDLGFVDSVSSHRVDEWADEIEAALASTGDAAPAPEAK
jgi:hypothetical protein